MTLDKIKIVSTKDFENYINSKIDGLNFEVSKNKPIEIQPEQIEMLCKLFQNKSNEWSYDFIKVLLNDILKKPTSYNGKVYEALVYSWLDNHSVRFKPQENVLSKDCLKAHDYEADGIIDGNIYFDVKQFGITLPHLDTLKRKLQEKIPEPYFVTVGGTKNISTRELEEKYLSRLPQLVKEIMSEENKLYCDYLYKDKDSGIEIRLHNREHENIFTSISEFDSYEWAENNQFYFMYHASQFCLNSPYIIICPFDGTCCCFFVGCDTRDVYDMLRPLCRRMFMNLINIKDRDICEFDDNAKEGIKVSTAARKVSAIVFLDVSKEYSFSEARMWAFLNPNADNKILNYQAHQLFRLNGAYVEDFRFDNY